MTEETTLEDQVESTATEQEEGAQGGESESEAEARRLGWKPQDEWKGNPKDWKPAEKFIRDGENTHGYLKKQVDHLKRTIHAQTQAIATISQREYDRAKAELEAAMEVAVDDGDKERVNLLRQQEKSLEKVKPQDANFLDPAALDFQERNADWIGKDVKKTRYAEVLAKEYDVQVSAGKITIEEAIEKIEEELEEVFSKKAPKEQPAKPAIQRTGASSSQRGGGGKEFSSLPPEAKDVCESLMATAKTPEDKAKIQKQYIKDYFGA
jgi:hypothetical protein